MRTKKHLGGRPPLPPDEVRSAQVLIRITQADHGRYAKAADALGETMADAARDGLERMARRAGKLTPRRGRR